MAAKPENGNKLPKCTAQIIKRTSNLRTIEKNLARIYADVHDDGAVRKLWVWYGGDLAFAWAFRLWTMCRSAFLSWADHVVWKVMLACRQGALPVPISQVNPHLFEQSTPEFILNGGFGIYLGLAAAPASPEVVDDIAICIVIENAGLGHPINDSTCQHRRDKVNELRSSHRVIRLYARDAEVQTVLVAIK